ncbi:thermonuclease family protein [Microcoleus sp. N9_B4]|uniref:thermonuclease family protein n=1 Tax=Microcoleus sp. N9_B4 TaxID=3055386 RepID=UPI002FD605B1
MNKFINAIPLIFIGVLGYFSLTKAQPVSLLPENKQGPMNPDMPTNLVEYEVVPKSVHDGDTLRVRSPKGEVLKIRFACIDAPELKQPLGEESRNYLRSIISKGNNKVYLQPITVDRYGRTVAQLWNNSGLIQSQMTIAGWAYGYEQYKKDCPNWEAVRSAETYAQKNNLGLWRSNGEKPWDYRKSKR